ncbi:hypothetical protein HMF8227_00259 [Saliniradius amylolyticus]|uniref:SGNH hydrolase-type esterase domain-containing protein n=1 Tax=Saliniradius amylolyticus TaxID=2183582 RepID=A0A2S2E159_9ALTE|nr:hypothetical protein [Saliniradius amylolyticus]AWL10767.1 hypothetical protein HMF8227_00259 [Saliniradius amylolyticus]
MMRKLSLFILLAVGAFSISSAAKEIEKPEVNPSSTPQKVLFVGNSFSYFNGGLHNHVSNLIRAAGKWQRGQNRYRMKTLSGGKLYEHVAGMPYLADQPKGKAWDMVVIQGHSNESVTKKRYKKFVQGAKVLTKVIRQHGAEPVLFMTWPYKHHKEMTDALHSSYVSLGNHLDALVAPVGLAFDHVNHKHPEIDLYHADVKGFTEQGDVIYKEDLKHPSLAGTYLAACVFYATFYQESPQGLAYDADLPKEVANALQAAAWQTYQQFYGVSQ